MERLEFDPLRHVYSVDGRPVPSVTQVLRATGISPSFDRVAPDVLEHKRQIGLALHAAIHILHDEDLDMESIDPEVAPYLMAYNNFCTRTEFKADETEVVRWPKINGLRYGMRADAVGKLFGKPTVVDFKTGVTHPSWGIQLGAYALGLPTPLTPPFHYQRVTLQFWEDGEYELKQWEDQGDYDEFKVALFLVWRRINRGEDIWNSP